MRQVRSHVGSGGFVYVVVAALILVAALYTQANLLFWSFGLMVGGLIASIALSWLMLRDVTVTRLLPSHGVAGESMPIRYVVSNRHRLIPLFNLVITETWPAPPLWRRAIVALRGKRTPQAEAPAPLLDQPARLLGAPSAWVLHLGPGQTTQAEAPCWPLRRGELQFSTIELSTSFPFGVVRRAVCVAQRGRVLVYPRLHRIDRRLLFELCDADTGGRRRQDRAGGAEEFFGLRQYRPGDSLRMVDWKRSARTGDLVCREMTMPTPPRVMLALDLTDAPSTTGNGHKAGDGNGEGNGDGDDDQHRADPVEQAISLTASLVCDAHLHGYCIGLAVLGVQCPLFAVHHSLPHRTRLLEALARLDLRQRRTTPPQMTLEPSVIVRPGAAPAGNGGAGQQRSLLLGSAHMSQYVIQGQDDSAVTLLRPRLGRRGVTT